MPKSDKPMIAIVPDRKTAEKLLESHGVAPDAVEEALQFMDGSMQIFMQQADHTWTLTIDGRPAFAAEITAALQVVGIQVKRKKFKPSGNSNVSGR